MADNERNQDQGGTNSVLGQQAQGDTGRNRDQVPPLNPTQAQADQGQTGQGPQTSGQGTQQQGFAQQGEGQPAEGQQGLGAATDQLGENKQTYGASSRQDATFGQGPQQANLDARGQTGVIGAGPAQTEGQPSSAATGGPNLSEGLRDQNSRGDGS